MSALGERGVIGYLLILTCLGYPKKYSEGGCLKRPHFVNANCGKEDMVLNFDDRKIWALLLAVTY